jgi:hypothetical protein
MFVLLFVVALSPVFLYCDILNALSPDTHFCTFPLYDPPVFVFYLNNILTHIRRSTLFYAEILSLSLSASRLFYRTHNINLLHSLSTRCYNIYLNVNVCANVFSFFVYPKFVSPSL